MSNEIKELNNEKKVDTKVSNNNNDFIGGATENDLDETVVEYEPFYNIKVIGTVDSYQKFDNSVQLISYTEEDKKIEGTDVVYTEKVKHTIRLNKILTDIELEKMVGKQFELTDIKEFHSYKQMPNGDINYGHIVSTAYKANTIKPSTETIGTNFKVYRTIEILVDNVQPILSYDKKKRKQVLSNDSLIQYMEKNGTKNNMFQLIVRDINFNVMKEYTNKKIKIFDLNQTMFKGNKSWECRLIKAL